VVTGGVGGAAGGDETTGAGVGIVVVVVGVTGTDGAGAAGGVVTTVEVAGTTFASS
jgi:hypothetical protein